MFTGLIEEIGTVRSIEINNETGQTILTIQGDTALQDVVLGDSIAINGVCLTVTSFDKQHNIFTVGLSPETLDRSNFKDLKVNSNVNCERSVTASTRLGGHVVQGHVDTTGTIVDKQVQQDMLVITIHIDNRNNFAYIVEKGYIAIDGTSLTITNVDTNKQTFSVMLIQYTQSKIILPQKDINDTVNLEFDILGKYFVNYMNLFSDKIQVKQ